MKPTACYEMVVTSKEAARDMLKSIIRWCGLGFHPDTPAKDYIDPVTKEPALLPFEAEMFDANIHNAFELLDDIYQDSLDIWHELGMISNKEYYHMSGENYITDTAEVIEAIEAILLDVVGEHGEAFHVTSELYPEDRTTLTINLLDRDGTHRVMDMAQIIHDAIFKKTGRHLSIVNNSPTDGALVVFLDTSMDEPFDIDKHKKNFIKRFKDYQANDPLQYQGKHSDAIVYQTLKDVVERECYGDMWEDALSGSYEIWHQVMTWARNGLSNPNL